LSFSLFVASIAGAASFTRPDDFSEIKAGQAVTIRADRAYLLFRTNSKETRVFTGLSPVFLRVPTAAEMEAYNAAKRTAFAKAEPELKRRRQELLAQKTAAERTGQKFTKIIPPPPGLDTFEFAYNGTPNVYSVSLRGALEKSDDGRVLLIDATPGTYVLYGWGAGDSLYTCLCLGSVSFSAEPGKITDLGTIFVALAAEPSPIPELKPVTGLGRGVNGGHAELLASAVRPASDATPIPAAVAGKPIVRADYRATGKFVSPFAFGIHRLAPIPGVLGYDRRGRVLDLVTATPAEDHFY
ncbi:MAG: hypothetical protein M3Q69_19865, partial [Acidobacteriota bacterium]|nr:hypothetical protein [Acidobacteriota bacterium]